MELIYTLAGVLGATTLLFFLIFEGSIINYKQYRRYFENRLNGALRQSFIKTSVSKLFLFTVSGAIFLTTLGGITIGLHGAMTGLLVSLLLPFVVIKRIQKRRTTLLTQQLPDGLHALAATLRSGANMSRGLEQLANWQPAPLSQEIGIVVAEYEFGRSLEEALDSFHARMPLPEIELMNTAIVLSKNVGGNVSDTLETLAITLSEKLAVEGKVESLTSTGRLQGWVAMAIPVVVGAFILKMQPDKAHFFFNDVRGYLTLAIVAVLMILAYVSIQRIVKIDI